MHDLASRRRRLLVSGAFAAFAAPLACAASRDRRGEAPAAMLAELDDGRSDPAGWLVSEKYDGVRAVWDGRSLRHRSGRLVSAPRAWVDALPSTPLDGELWLGRRRFDALSALVRRGEPDADAWRHVRYLVFELPGGAGTFAERARRIDATVAMSRHPTLVAVAQTVVADRRELGIRLDAVVAAGGEGLMLHDASAPFVSGRTGALRKLKPVQDDEAVVVGHRAGTGRLAGAVGSLAVRDDAGRQFFVGSGLDDALRRHAPPVGSRITYRFRDRTPAGLPRFATYLRRRDDL